MESHINANVGGNVGGLLSLERLEGIRNRLNNSRMELMSGHDQYWANCYHGDVAPLLAHADALARERRDVEELARTLAVESEWVMATKKDMAAMQAEIDRLRELAKELAEALWHAMDGCGEPFCRDGSSVGDYAALAKARQEGLL